MLGFNSIQGVQTPKTSLPWNKLSFPVIYFQRTIISIRLCAFLIVVAVCKQIHSSIYHTTLECSRRRSTILCYSSAHSIYHTTFATWRSAGAPPKFTHCFHCRHHHQRPCSSGHEPNGQDMFLSLPQSFGVMSNSNWRTKSICSLHTSSLNAW